jgi:hypothetical protein
LSRSPGLAAPTPPLHGEVTERETT